MSTRRLPREAGKAKRKPRSCLWARTMSRAALALALGLTTQSGCASVPAQEFYVERIVVENVSSDVVRVILRLDDRDVRLGRVGPFDRAALRLPAGTLSPGHASGRLIVIPLGAPSLGWPALPALAVSSDVYPAGDVVRNVWRFTGSRIIALGLPR